MSGPLSTPPASCTGYVSCTAERQRFECEARKAGSTAATAFDPKLPNDLRAYADREQTHNGLVLAHGETLRLAADALDETQRVVAAARWYVRCVEFGLRTDCSWFELRAAVKEIAPEEVGDGGA